MKSRKDLIEELNQTIQRTSTLTTLHTNAVANKIGISATEFESMDVISHYQPMSAGKLAIMCGLTTGAITGIVDRLERAGLVHRERDPEDRRRVYLLPVDDPEKSQRIRDLYCPMGEAFQRIMQQCTAEQIQFLIDVHKKMNDEVETIIADLRDK